MPKLDTTWSKNKCATEATVSYPSPTKTGISLTHMVSLSIQVKMPLKELQISKSVIKSMDYIEERLFRLLVIYNKLAY